MYWERLNRQNVLGVGTVFQLTSLGLLKNMKHVQKNNKKHSKNTTITNQIHSLSCTKTLEFANAIEEAVSRCPGMRYSPRLLVFL